jgi:uncharacterized protein (DUF2249 family)
MTNNTVTVDVRDDIRNGGDPFAKIMKAVAALGADEQLLLIAPFEPVPLLHVMEKKGFRHSAHPIPSGDWQVLFLRYPERQSAPSAPPTTFNGGLSCSASEGIEDVDARGLEPPQPLVKILEATAVLPAGAQLRAWTDRRPLHLYSQLEIRGFSAETEEQSDGSFLTHIRRR